MAKYKHFIQTTESVIEKYDENGKAIGSFKAGHRARNFLIQQGVNLSKAACPVPEDLVKQLLAKRWLTTHDLPAPRYLACYNYKGGIGKTSMAAGLGLALAEQGKKVLLVDADPQSSLSILFLGPEQWFDVQNNNGSMWNLYEPLVEKKWASVGDPALIPPAVHPLEDPRLQEGGMGLLVGNVRVARLETALAYGVFEGVRMGGGLDFQNHSVKVFQGIPDYAVAEGYDYVLFDAPPSFTIPTIAAMLVADEIIAPIDDDLSTFYGIWLFDGLRKDLIANDEVRGLAPQLEFEKAVAKYRYAVPSRYENLEAVRNFWEDHKGKPIWSEVLRDVKMTEKGIPYDREISGLLQAGEPFELMDTGGFDYFRSTANLLFPEAFSH